MSFLKNLFGNKNKKNKKFEGNTLAETNGSPDNRKETAVEASNQTTVKGECAPAVEVKAPEVKSAVAAKTTAKPTAAKSDDKPAASTKAEPKQENTAKKEPEKIEVADQVQPDASENQEVVTASKNVRTGKFEIKKSKDGRFVFNLYASNNVIVATSQVYSSSTAAMNGIKSVIANAATSPIEDQTLKNVTTVNYPKWELYLDKGDQYRFRLCASNGSCVCHSQGYTTKANCKKGIESIIKFASDAEITKVYLEKKDN